MGSEYDWGLHGGLVSRSAETENSMGLHFPQPGEAVKEKE